MDYSALAWSGQLLGHLQQAQRGTAFHNLGGIGRRGSVAVGRLTSVGAQRASKWWRRGNVAAADPTNSGKRGRGGIEESETKKEKKEEDQKITRNGTCAQ